MLMLPEHLPLNQHLYLLSMYVTWLKHASTAFSTMDVVLCLPPLRIVLWVVHLFRTFLLNQLPPSRVLMTSPYSLDAAESTSSTAVDTVSPLPRYFMISTWLTHPHVYLGRVRPTPFRQLQ